MIRLALDRCLRLAGSVLASPEDAIVDRRENAVPDARSRFAPTPIDAQRRHYALTGERRRVGTRKTACCPAFLA
jgi:hypothetical protein